MEKHMKRILRQIILYTGFAIPVVLALVTFIGHSNGNGLNDAFFSAGLVLAIHMLWLAPATVLAVHFVKWTFTD